MKRLLAAFLLISATAFAQPTYDMTADANYPNRDLQSLKMLQGATPKLRVYIQQKGSTYTNIATDTLTFYYAESPTATAFVTVTNSAVNTANGYFDIDFTSGDLNTNGSFYYTVLLKSASGGTYWSGDGSLEIEETTVTGSPGVLTLTTPIDWITATYTNTELYGPYLAGTNITFSSSGTNGQVFINTTSGGDVTGPASAGDEKIAVYDGTTGKIIKDGSSSISDITTAYTAADTVVSNGVTSGYQAGDALLLPLSGGTMAGNIAMSLQSITGIGGLVFGSSGGNVYGVDDNDFIGLFGGATNSAGILVYGSDHPTNPGDLWLVPYGGVVDIFGNAQIQGTLDMTNNAISGVSSVTFETNSTSHSSGTLNGTNGVFYTQNGTNYWILFN